MGKNFSDLRKIGAEAPLRYIQDTNT
jgi:hypothetical protein